jgi:superfamily II DNA or RNA helicase
LSQRIKEQESVKLAIRENKYNCAILASVGFGKSKVMVDIAEELLSAGRIQNILYVCDNRRLRDSKTDGFPAEVEKWGSPKLQRIVTYECYQTVYKWENRKFDLLLADEFDFAITKEYLKAIINNVFKYKILMSGTLSKSKQKIVTQIVPIAYTIRTNEAEDKGIVNKSHYYVYNYKLTDSESREYNSLTKKIATLLKIQTPYDDPEFQFFLRKRKQFLATLETSYLHCRKIMKHVYNKDHDNRVIIFCEQTSQADKVCRYSFHGKNEEDDNFSKFQNGEINALSVVAKIKRGINVKKCNVAIFEAFSGSSTEWEQRSGRMKRLKTNEIAQIVFMIPWYKKINSDGNSFYKRTVVGDWLYRATENIPNIEFKTLKL